MAIANALENPFFDDLDPDQILSSKMDLDPDQNPVHLQKI